MIIPDVNLLVYTADATCAHHDEARDWWQRTLNDNKPVGLAWHSILGYVRILSDQRILKSPAAVDDLLDDAENWLARPHVALIRPAQHHLQALRSMCRGSQFSGETLPDAHLAALAVTYRGTIYSADSDFGRFPDIRWVNPLAA